MVADNASNNATLVVELESLGGINNATTRIRCFAHILNLVVKVSNDSLLITLAWAIEFTTLHRLLSRDLSRDVDMPVLH